MRTDTALDRPDGRIIVDAKFADAPKPNRFGRPRLLRNHMFPLYAYVQSQHNRNVGGAIAEGALRFPVADANVCEFVSSTDTRCRFLAVDLAAED